MSPFPDRQNHNQIVGVIIGHSHQKSMFSLPAPPDRKRRTLALI
jgi:hypothetical protein